MRNFTKLFLVFVFSTSVLCAFSQKADRASNTSSSDTTITATLTQTSLNAPADTLKRDTTKKEKDIQNQLQFMKPDMESKNYNFYNRRQISTPLMPPYDLDSAVYQNGSKRQKQQKAYLNKQYAFPAKPKNQWELGFNFGAAYISGNVQPYISGTGVLQNLGGGITVRKALGYVFSLRGGYDIMVSTGRNYQPDHNLEFNPVFHGTYDPRVNYWNNPALTAQKTNAGFNMNTYFFYNYRCYTNNLHLEGVFNVGNINFHRERNMINFYVFGGASLILFSAYTNALDANGHVYDFSNVMQLFLSPLPSQNVGSRLSLRSQSLRTLSGIYDHTYETPIEHPNDQLGFGNWQLAPAGNIGVGVQFHLSKKVTLGIEERITITQQHLDGYFWQQDEHTSLVSHYDNISYTSVHLNVHLGGKKKTEPLYWLNPVYHSYRKLGEVDPAALMAEMYKDDDDDGVPNYLDRQPNTPKGCPVDEHGVALDSDHDGIIDCLDKEPYSPPGYPIDANGVAIIPPNPCCDTNRFYRNNIQNNQVVPNQVNPNYPSNPTNPANPIYNNNQNNVIDNTGNSSGGGGQIFRKQPGYDCSKIELPSVIFDNDKYYLDPQYYGNLHQIAERMQLCPDVKLVSTGFDESRNDQKYNEQLGWNRSNAAIDYLVEKYGISRDRFIVKYQGGKKAAVGTPYEKKMKNKVEFRYANEGESGESNPPAPHPGLKAGSNK